MKARICVVIYHSKHSVCCIDSYAACFDVDSYMFSQLIMKKLILTLHDCFIYLRNMLSEIPCFDIMVYCLF